MDNRKAIYLDDAIDALESKKDKKAKGDIGGFYNKIIQNDIDALMQLPSADPEAAIVKVLKMVEEYKEKTGTDEIIIMPKNGMKAWDENGVEYTMQPTCNQLATDCISRAAAIDAVNTWFELYVVNRTTANAVSIQDMLRALPSARPEQRWILCSERVPEEDEQVLVYLYDSPYIAWIDSNGEWNTEEFTLDKEKEREDEPIAWMPLPEPYKERREE